MKTVTVKASKEYDVKIGSGILESIGESVKAITNECKVALVTDSKVNELYADIVEKELESAGFSVCKFVFEDGEKSKNPTVLFEILEFLAENHLTRSDLLIALGGGVVGDMSGFAAATYLRGIRFVQIPTTLLAAVDSSVGGKTAVNLNAGKNLVGAFYQPEMVVCDFKTLDTLSEKIFADGMAEVIKYGVIADKKLFDIVKTGDVKNHLEDIIFNCVSIKRDIVCADEFENGARKLLNFGHTVGHAIEKCSDFEIAHGSAIAIGMVIVSRSANKLGLSKTDCTKDIVDALKANDLPFECSFNSKELADVALSDKKRNGETISLILPKEIGECYIYKIKADELENFIAKGLED